jgi:hypothetical protein
MKKKINYGNIPNEVLKLVIGEDYFYGGYNLKSELDKYGEDIIFARYELNEDKTFINWFHAWTKTYVMCLIEDAMFGDRIILGLNRAIPPELIFKESSQKGSSLVKIEYEENLNGRNKKERKRTKRKDSKTIKR